MPHFLQQRFQHWLTVSVLELLITPVDRLPHTELKVQVPALSKAFAEDNSRDPGTRKKRLENERSV